MAERTLADRAAAVLRGNDAGGWTRAAPRLYPHQWSWDAAFIAIGWARLDVARAMSEQRKLFAAQWATGMVPHIVFDETAPDGSYFPDARRWDAGVSPAAPAVATSGLCQPPVHALAVAAIAAAGAADEYVRDMVPRLLAWHRYLATARDPEGSGLVTIYHPWESGADNSPRWDATLERVEVGDLPPYRRRDTGHVADAAQRPSDREYDRYLWLVELLKRCRYDDAEIQESHPFLVKDVFFSAILVAANEALLRLCEAVGAPAADRDAVAGWIERGRRALADRIDPELHLCLDHDVRAGTPVRCRTFAGFAPLVAGMDAGLLAELESERFLAAPGLRWPLLVSTSPADPAYRSRTYWRGPTWPVVNWLLWRGLRAAGEPDRAERLRRAGLDQVAESGFFEYFEPVTGEPLGSPDQSWTAAVTLDWLAGY